MNNIYVNSRIYEQKTTGIGYYIQSLFSKLQKNDEKNKYIFLQTSDSKQLGKTIKLYGRSDGFLGILFDVFSTFIYLLRRSSKSSIYIGGSFFLPFWRIKSTKYIVVIYDLSFLIFPENHSKSFNIIYKYLTGRSIKNADVIIAISNNTKEDIIKFYGDKCKDKIKVIYPGINEIFIDPKFGERLIKDKYLFSVTTHPKRKNILSVIRALGILKDQGIIIKYIIAGVIPESQKNQLMDEAKLSGIEDQIFLWGYVSEEDLANLYYYAEIFLYPSFYEGFGFPVIEAVYCKTLVITSDASSTRELLPNREFLVDPNNLIEISDKIKYCLGLDPIERDKIIEGNLDFAKKFSRDSASKGYANILSL